MSKLDTALIERNKQAVQAASPLFDELNKSWEQIEKFLRKQGILHEVEHCIGSFGHPEHGPDGEKYLGIQKRKGEWRVCYGVYYYQDPEQETNWTPIADCPTELRVQLLDEVNALFEKLVKTNEDYVPEMEKAVAKSHSILADLGIAKKK